MNAPNPIDDADNAIGCANCRNAESLGIKLRMAYQPIYDVVRSEVYAWEALARGPEGQSAGSIISALGENQLYRFDQTCRTLAIATAAGLGMRELLSINFLPNAVYEPAACIRITLAAANKYGFPLEQLILELSEAERIFDPKHALRIVRDYQSRGFKTAIDDFGAGYAGLNLLADFQPTILKLDMELIRDVDTHPVRAMIVSNIVDLCRKLSVKLVAEGVETLAECLRLRELGVELFQGYFFARPQMEALPAVPDSVLNAIS